MNSIGGYFELELRKGEEFHKNSIRLNIGRRALELILKVKQYKKVYIPYYTCDVILEPFIKLKIDFEFYCIDEKLEPLFNYKIIKGNEGFLYINYFGMKDSFISSLSYNCQNLIIDNSQAFYSLPKPNVPTFYSCRKFFGVPDGAYLYLTDAFEFDFPTDNSSSRLTYLLNRIEDGAQTWYNDFKANEDRFKLQPLMRMSNLTKALLKNVDYDYVKERRRNNFLFLHEVLLKYNGLKLNIHEDFVPMGYPLLINNSELRHKFIKNKVFVASYWTNVTEWSKKSSIEYYFSKNLLIIPIDQRWGSNEMKYILTILKRELKWI